MSYYLFNRQEILQKAKKKHILKKKLLIKTNLLSNGLPKENTYYTCIAGITIDSALIMNKKNYAQVYLEECKYKIKKIKTPRFINIELETDSESDAETDSEVDTTEH